MLSFFWDFVRKLETLTRESDQAGFYKHLKTVNLEGKRDRSSAYVKDENGVLLRDVELIRERWVRWFHTLLNAKSPRLDSNIAEGLDQWPENMPVGVQPTMQELTDAIRSLANGKAVGPDGVSIGFKADKGIMDALVHLRKKRGVGGRGKATAGESVLATPLRGMLYADDAGVVSQSPEQPRKMMGVIVIVCVAFGLTVSEAKILRSYVYA